jgi:hypothetical protein
MRLYKRKILWRKRLGWHTGLSQPGVGQPEQLSWLRRALVPFRPEPEVLPPRPRLVFIVFAPVQEFLQWLKTRLRLPVELEEAIVFRRGGWLFSPEITPPPLVVPPCDNVFSGRPDEACPLPSRPPAICQFD